MLRPLLPGDQQMRELTKRVGPLRFELELPTAWKGFFGRQGQMPTSHGEKRRFPRNYFRACAALQYRQTLPSVHRADTWYKVYTSSVSRNGILILHSEQLFPAEQMTLVLPDFKTRFVEIARCRRVEERCYEVGAEFISRISSFPAAVG